MPEALGEDDRGGDERSGIGATPDLVHAAETEAAPIADREGGSNVVGNAKPRHRLVRVCVAGFATVTGQCAPRGP